MHLDNGIDNGHIVVHKPQTDTALPAVSRECSAVDTLGSATLLAFSGGALNAFLYLNHGNVFAGVMSGNAVLGGIALFNHGTAGVMHYDGPIFAYLCGIWLVAVFQDRVKHHATAISLSCVIAGLLIASFLPIDFPEWPYISFVVLLTGFLVGIARKVDTYAYNATVLTGSLRDGAIALHKALNPATRAESLRMARDLWGVMASFVAGAAAGGLLGRHIGNHALWLPIFTILVVLTRVLRSGRVPSTLEQLPLSPKQVLAAKAI